MLKEYFNSFSKDRDFRSRTGKTEFWKAIIPDMIIWAVIICGYFLIKDIDIVFIICAAAYFLITCTARFALWTRRMHDVGIAGTFSFVILIPVIGLLALAFVFMSDSQKKDNAYGKYVPEKKAPKKTKSNNKNKNGSKR